MKRLFLTLAAALLLPPACSYLPPPAGTEPTPVQQKISDGLQSIAGEVRKAENAAMTPAAFGADLDALAFVLPVIAPYVFDAKLAYAAVLTAGNLTVEAGERLAERYDS